MKSPAAKKGKSTRRVGTETSETRASILRHVERLMLTEGYAAITYRKVAAVSGVTAPLVQYYFPTIDDLFVALLRQHAEPNLAKLKQALEEHPDDPQHVVWAYNADEATAALMTEFMALGNHRKAIRTEIAAVSAKSRKLQLDALSGVVEPTSFGKGGIPSAALLFLLAGIPKIMQLESALGVSTGHAEILKIVEDFLQHPQADRAKPAQGGSRSSAAKPAGSKARARSRKSSSPTAARRGASVR